MADRPPFVILGTPRSRTAWLSAMLTWGGWTCLHEPSIHFRSLDDLKAMLDRPQVGAADNMLTLLWPEIVGYRPDVRIVVVRRPAEDVLVSLASIGDLPKPVAPLLRNIIREIDALTFPGALHVSFDDLRDNSCCQAIAMHTIGKRIPDDRLATLQAMNIQANYSDTLRATMRNYAGVQEVFGKHIAAAIREAA